jgi:hypothetical protein
VAYENGLSIHNGRFAIETASADFANMPNGERETLFSEAGTPVFLAQTAMESLDIWKQKISGS